MKLPVIWELPEQIKMRFGQKGAGKQRTMFAEGHLLLVLHKVPVTNARERETVFFWRNADAEWNNSGHGRGIRHLQEHIEEYNKVEQQISQAYDRAEKSEQYFDILEDLTQIRRAAKYLYETLQAAREAVQDDRELIDLRDTCQEIYNTLDLLYIDPKNGLDFSMAKKAEEQALFSQQAARSGHRLNILAAIFFPLTALSSFFGMNLSHGFEGAPPFAFWSVLALGIMLGIFMCLWVIKGLEN